MKRSSTVGLAAAAAALAGVIIAVAPGGDAAPTDKCHGALGSYNDGHYLVPAGETWNEIGAKFSTTGSALRAVNLNASPSGLNTNLPTGACIHVATDPGVPPSSTTAPTSSTAAPTTTVTPTSTTSPATTTTASPTTTTTPPTTTTAPPQGGTFTETFSNGLGNWVFASGRASTSGDGQNGADATVVNGQLRIRNGEQNYGDATLRSTVQYNLSAGGEVRLDISDDGRGDVLIGSAYVMFSAGPQDGREQHTTDDRPTPYSIPINTPTEGVTVWLRTNCRVPWGPPIAVTYPARTTQHGTCVNDPDGELRLVYTPGSLSIRNGDNEVIVTYNVTLPPTGFLTLGVHNHASIKTTSQAGLGPLLNAVTGVFDNVTYPTGGTPSTPTTTSPSTTSAPPTTQSVPSSSSTPSTTSPPTSSTSAPTTTVPAGVAFTEDFTTDQQARFDWQLHTSNNGGTNTKIAASLIGEHNTACQGPDTYRTILTGSPGSPSYVDVSGSPLIWYCAPGNDPAKGHLMTALDTTDIATLSFSPKQTFNNPTRVCWSQNMNDLGEAKWVNVFVVAASNVAANNGNLNYAAATGLAFGGVDQMLPAGSYDFTWLRGTTFVNGAEMMWASNAHGIATSSPPRFQICLNDRGRQLVIQRPDGTTDTINTGRTFPTGEVKVIFQDASYNPTKHNGFENHLTWHWDEIVIATQ